MLSGTDNDYVHFIYFSLVSLKTVGFGDIYAGSTPAKMLGGRVVMAFTAASTSSN